MFRFAKKADSAMLRVAFSDQHKFAFGWPEQMTVSYAKVFEAFDAHMVRLLMLGGVPGEGALP